MAKFGEGGDVVIQNLSMVTRVVEDQDRAIEFYTEKFGFELTGDHPGPHGRFVTVAPGSDEVDLVLVSPDGFPDDEVERLRAQIGNDGGMIYLVEDCQGTYEELRDRGVEFRGEPEEMPWGTQVVALDPDGNETVLQERPGN